ncbi:hypothetical protein GH733_003446 [Mirounga leonina]|nr:hypothetical protein GH733_003446 [Mirounga leonina]
MSLCRSNMTHAVTTMQCWRWDAWPGQMAGLDTGWENKAAKMRRGAYRARGRISPHMRFPCHTEMLLTEKSRLFLNQKWRLHRRKTISQKKLKKQKLTALEAGSSTVVYVHRAQASSPGPDICSDEAQPPGSTRPLANLTFCPQLLSNQKDE